jgi:hypothetical protein
VSPVINQHMQASDRTTFHVGFFLDFLISSEDVGDMFLENVVDFQQTTWRYIAVDRTVHKHRCQNLTFFNCEVKVHYNYYLKVCDDGTLVQILSIILSLSKITVLFIFQNRTFRKLDFISVFR